uniref:Uncharacterized protein n=1 Tax=Timema bartmani TaxID=61472 RepID=A0A7R9I8J9_9NEOP|nr:unnamed protein product [Timema bartmani]
MRSQLVGEKSKETVIGHYSARDDDGRMNPGCMNEDKEGVWCPVRIKPSAFEPSISAGGF